MAAFGRRSFVRALARWGRACDRGFWMGRVVWGVPERSHGSALIGEGRGRCQGWPKVGKALLLLVRLTFWRQSNNVAPATAQKPLSKRLRAVVSARFGEGGTPSPGRQHEEGVGA